jgi:predicted TIM-barrel fold metal-dependent hydrolase
MQILRASSGAEPQANTHLQGRWVALNENHKKEWAMNRSVAVVLAASLGVSGESALHAQEPIIDMHMHARVSAVRTSGGEFADPPCFPAGCVPFPTIVKSDEDVLGLALEAMDRNNIVLGVVTDANLEHVYQWANSRPGRFLAGGAVFDPLRADTAELRAEFEAGRLQIMGEIGTQYRGYPPDDPANEPFFALAEQLGVPTLVHVEGVAGASASFRISHGHPERLEEVLARHPTLRLWLENAAYPFLDEAIALMYRYPEVYADVSTITWIIPRAEFWRYLEALVDAGLCNRIMWGSDQMNWPGTIDRALQAISEAPFLSDAQKRDIFYNNAARFLRLTPEEIAAHHGR